MEINTLLRAKLKGVEKIKRVTFGEKKLTSEVQRRFHNTGSGKITFYVTSKKVSGRGKFKETTREDSVSFDREQNTCGLK